MKKNNLTLIMPFSFILFMLLYNYADSIVLNQTLIDLRLLYILVFALFYLFLYYSRRKRLMRKRK
ncbi:MAG: hypothetical protein JJU01_09025 [Alkalibacterium sp.]|nr:hypothetical protein [Alkalibacterium sp.]